MSHLEQELINNALEIVEASLRRGEEIRFLGEIKLDFVKQELVPNLHNPNLMDSAKIYYYSGLFEIQTGKKRKRKIFHRYYVGQVTERLEVGSYWDRRD